MRIPRRVPWASKAELAELYDMLFSPGANEASRQAALSRMSVYVSCPSCPAFLHLLHALVSALTLPYPPNNAAEATATRMAYGMAVVRFVNGMVDPLQTGPYARPISHLASTLGLPPSLVSLRHRATHEDLPPLPLLRRAVEQATEYLHRQSFLPLLASSSAAGWDRRAKLEGLVGDWKRIVKQRVRTHDVTNESESGLALRRLKREIDAEDGEELVEAVVRTGLVPVGRKKRSPRRSLRPTKESLAIWAPLLSHLNASSPIASALLEALVTAILDTAPRFNPPLPDADVEDHRKEMDSYRWTLGTWLLWLWDGEGDEMSVGDEERTGVLRRLARELLESDDVLRRIYDALESESKPPLKDLDALLLPPESLGSDEELEGLEIDEEKEGQMDVEEQLKAMEANLAALNQKLSHQPAQSTLSAPDSTALPGWTRPGEWKAAPIGVWV